MANKTQPIDKKFQYSKIIVCLSWAVFIICLIVDFTAVFSSVYETAVLVTATSVSAAVCGSATVWLSKKSASENQIKLRMALYRTSIDERLRFNREMLKMQQKYGKFSDETRELDEYGDADDFMRDALSGAISVLDNAQNEADAPNEIQNFSL